MQRDTAGGGDRERILEMIFLLAAVLYIAYVGIANSFLAFACGFIVAVLLTVLIYNSWTLYLFSKGW